MHMTQAQLLAQLQQIKTVTSAQIAYYQTDGQLKISTDEQPQISPEPLFFPTEISAAMTADYGFSDLRTEIRFLAS